MNTIKNYRYWILIALMLLAIIGLFSECESIKLLLTTKIVGILAAWKGYQLCTVWEAKGDLPELTELLKD